jgi:[ribosomal protein S5]-alanine N-acetyltransferase
VSIFPLPIWGECVSVRRLEEHDLEGLYALETDADVKRYVGGPVLRPRDEWVNCMRDRLGAENCTLAVELRKDGSFVGRASLAKTFLRTWQSVDIEWEMRILIARKFWSRGFGREVAGILIRAGFALAEVTSIVAVVDPENAASRNLMDNLGFQYVDQKSSPGALGRQTHDFPPY